MLTTKQKSEEVAKQKFKENFMKLFKQIKEGCKKPICFKHDCRKNLLSKLRKNGSDNFVVDLNFASDQEILKYALNRVQKTDDTAALTCAEATVTDNEAKIDLPETINLHGASAVFLMQNLEWFCCSFVQNIVSLNAGGM